MIKIKNLVKKYPIVNPNKNLKQHLKEALKLEKKSLLTALDDVSFDVKKGEIFGVLGPNGAGKTTLLKVLAGFLLPEGGTVSVNGFDVIRERHEVRTSCNFLRAGGWVIFDYKFKISTMLKYWGVFLGLPLSEAKERVNYTLEKVGLLDKKDDYVENLSYGMRQKLNLARCLMTYRPIYLMDEPTTNIDPYSADFIRRFIQTELRREGATTVLATHNLWEAEQICDRIAILMGGKILTIGTVDEIKLKYALDTAVIQIKPITDDIRKKIKALGFVGDVVPKSDFVMIYGKDLKKNICEILEICYESKSKITYLDIIKPSLNEVFIQLMRDKNEQ